ncbi:TrkH family potassium uptake protein [Phytohalomonas tamaricis]|uniref:TrkH family potassium uptake protein n=1 Tax=Phytohalomonas tamaricis TaxID=2081032 RepID=UPI000D0B94F9|nr:TrkH family potassium uptake protein [Phytohalomonas tamaricis]
MTQWKRFIHPARRLHHGTVLRLHPPEILLLSFVMLAVIGMLFLKLPFASVTTMTWLEALFTATSAITVTGLGVINTGQDLTFYGQLIILVLIQIGGLGLMTFASLTLVLLGGRLPLNQKNLVRESLNQTSLSNLMGIVRVVIIFSFIMEITGTLLLSLSWVPHYGLQHGLWVSMFHAISAFNNAGFSTWSDSLRGEVTNPLVNFVISFLFITGGLGFAVISELYEKRSLFNLSMQAKLIIYTTIALNVVAMGLFLLLEWHNPATLGGLDSLGVKLQAAWFQAVTPRTAGFNTLDTAALTTPSVLLIMLLMVIGGGPSSTSSGIKVTTFVVLFLTARAFLRGNKEPDVFRRSLSQETVMKAISVALAAVSLIFVALFLLTVTEPKLPFINLAFETVSAFGTVGLSRGITSELSGWGQIILIITMLLGRVGPLALGYFLATNKHSGMRYAEGRIQIG